eukprot:TRINITY_DN6944_c0_g1_i2.p1 TRINITY_DN6944_c0_g1~~TRINITY_DN6944_c0_g1_i2.p1  ORF type:complete len:187 (+),score=26.78 TRINITY_DN6944_c0_g1_i2:86-562(+)
MSLFCRLSPSACAELCQRDRSKAEMADAACSATISTDERFVPPLNNPLEAEQALSQREGGEASLQSLRYMGVERVIGRLDRDVSGGSSTRSSRKSVQWRDDALVDDLADIFEYERTCSSTESDESTSNHLKKLPPKSPKLGLTEDDLAFLSNASLEEV